MEIKNLQQMVDRMEREAQIAAQRDREEAERRQERNAAEIRAIRSALQDLPSDLTRSLLDASAYVFASEIEVEGYDDPNYPNFTARIESMGRPHQITGSRVFRDSHDASIVKPGTYRVVLCLVPVAGGKGEPR